MSTSRHVTVWCDGHGCEAMRDVTLWRDEHLISNVEARADARATGWAYRYGHDLCPRCVQLTDPADEQAALTRQYEPSRNPSRR